MPSVITRALQAAIASREGPIPFSEFMEIALYHPEGGYYRRPEKRIGVGGDTDFFTATSTGPIFGELVVEACVRLLSPEEPSGFHFIEIGAEPGGSVLPDRHPFAETRTLRRGEPIDIPPRAVVFSNELFDAQPFHRLIFLNGAWRESGVDWRDGPREALMPNLSPPLERAAHHLPKTASEGYRLDLPLAAIDLLKDIVTASSWEGLLVAFDYGKSWRALIEATPQGTARAYHRHRQSNDLLASPGEQDLTCHVCWDWLQSALAENGFEGLSLQSQESFFIHHAKPAIEKVITARPGELDPRRQALQQLLHPGNMGQKFQVLSARR